MRAHHFMPQADPDQDDRKIADRLQQVALWLSLAACGLALLLAARLPL
jgi:hypothetical protein